MKIKEIKKELEHIHDNHMTLLDLMIYDETTAQLEEDLSEEELNELMGYIENAYLKADYVDLYYIVKYCIENRKKLDTMSTWDIVDHACLLY